MKTVNFSSTVLCVIMVFRDEIVILTDKEKHIAGIQLKNLRFYI
jgi:hypothetical protein